jgi:hypothetical protein
MKKLSISLILLFLMTSPVWAANYFVAKGVCSSSCDGSNWTRAWPELGQINWNIILPGDTIWVAGGTYSQPIKVAASGTSGNRIYIKRIRSTDPVCTSPCNATYDAQVILPNEGIQWTSGTDQLGSYVTIDGRIPYGIKSFGSNADSGAGVYIDTGNTGVVVQYVEMVGPGTTEGAQFLAAGDGCAFYVRPGSGRGTLTDITVRYCKLRGAVNLVKMSIDGTALFEYNLFRDNLPSNSNVYHNNVISAVGATVVTFRYNTVTSWDGEGIMLWSGAQTWKVYGNVWHDAYGYAVNYGRVVEAQEVPHTLYFYNNTLANAWRGVRVSNGGSYTASSQCRNNIYWNVSTDGVGDDDYEYSNNEVSGAHSIANLSNPFVSSSDFHIISTIGATYPRNKGVALAAEYNTDMDGVVRGADGTWDIGAYEYESRVLSPPRNIRITSQ